MFKIKNIGLFVGLLCWLNLASAQQMLSFPLPEEGISIQNYVQWQGVERSSVFDPIGFKGLFSIPNSASLSTPIQQVWLRMVIRNTVAKDTFINAFFEQSIWDISAFRSKQGALKEIAKAGFRTDPNQLAYRGNEQLLQITLRAAQTDTVYIYLRVLEGASIKRPFPKVYSGNFIPANAYKQQFLTKEPGRWFAFFIAGISLFIAIFTAFKSLVNGWEKANLYCALMFFSNFIDCLNQTHALQLLPFGQMPLRFGLWINELTPILMLLLYREFLNTRKERPWLYWLMSIGISLLFLTIVLDVAFTHLFHNLVLAKKAESGFETIMLVHQGILPFAFLPYLRHPIYRYAAWSSWVLLLAFVLFLLVIRGGWELPFQIWFQPIYLLFIAITLDGVLFSMALTQRDRQIALDKVRLEQQSTASELKALRAQMNPHFIFNCLNSIKSFTLNKDSASASLYLTKFSRLIRQVLENSSSEKITLSNELSTLQLYLEMEKLRVGDKFDYEILLDPDVEAEFIEVPPMLIQPYAENAIWHGILHKTEKGKVSIVIQQTDDTLVIRVVDDGVGRKKAAELKSRSGAKHKSFGMQITAERLSIIKQLYGIEASLHFEDLFDRNGFGIGTKVTLTLPL
ncbi:sensor histidine kinase [Haliscomenobacter hydrossis]|uniref:Signal transduction histidine kinase n=1 Tax=Haliscomenobacter hydrossis (strain ATCC 27775 / DSM 1100 / LMG 10767 / O) TaxID=760192 RepID=F4KQC4_HALH1|nr:histidine kinase [Haliscomenobacter hydrossis]AEE48950.1 putative signal transduction histidine kinase [Haliscomenobacter hydrossis DSM 1100]